MEITDIIPDFRLVTHDSDGELLETYRFTAWSGATEIRKLQAGWRATFKYTAPDGKRYVIKVDGDQNQSEAEVKLWNQLDNEDRKYFVPILASEKINGRFVIIEPFVEFVNSETDETWEELYKVVAKYRLQGDVADWGLNWGLTETGPIIYDYGYNPHMKGWKPLFGE